MANKIAMQAAPGKVYVGQPSTVTVTVSDDAGNPLSGEPVDLDAGTSAVTLAVNPADRKTDAKGQIQVTVTPQPMDRATTILLTAKAANAPDATAQIQVGSAAFASGHANPEKIAVGRASRITLTVEDADSKKNLTGLAVHFSLSPVGVGALSRILVTTNTAGRAETDFIPNAKAQGIPLHVIATLDDGTQKEIQLMGAIILDEKRKQVVQQHAEALKKKAEADAELAKLEEMKREIDTFAKVNLVPGSAALVDAYAAAYGKLTVDLKKVQDKLDALEKDPNLKVPAEQRSEIQALRANADKELKTKKEALQKVNKELTQLTAVDLAAAKEEADAKQKEYDKWRTAQATLEKVVADLQAEEVRLKAVFDAPGRTKQQELEIVRDLFAAKSRIAEEVNRYLLAAPAYQKQVEDAWKAWEAAKQKVNQVELDQAAKQKTKDELVQVCNTLEGDRGKIAIDSFIDSVVRS